MAGHRFNFNKADKLLSDERKKQLPFDIVMEKMSLKKHDVIADLGAGNGYFTIPIAKYTEETVYAVDIEPKMLGLLKDRAAHEQIENIHGVASDLKSVPIDNQSVDKALVSLVIHEVPSVEDTIKEIKRILKPNGILFLIEWKFIRSEDGPPVHERIPSKKLAEILRNLGFSTTVLELNADQYAIYAQMR